MDIGNGPMLSPLILVYTIIVLNTTVNGNLSTFYTMIMDDITIFNVIFQIQLEINTLSKNVI